MSDLSHPNETDYTTIRVTIVKIDTWSALKSLSSKEFSLKKPTKAQESEKAKEMLIETRHGLPMTTNFCIRPMLPQI